MSGSTYHWMAVPQLSRVSTRQALCYQISVFHFVVVIINNVINTVFILLTPSHHLRLFNGRVVRLTLLFSYKQLLTTPSRFRDNGKHAVIIFDDLSKQVFLIQFHPSAAITDSLI